MNGQNTVDDRLTSAVVSKTGGGDVEGEMVGVRTPLVCSLANVGFMGYKLVGSINWHVVVACYRWVCGAPAPFNPRTRLAGDLGSSGPQAGPPRLFLPICLLG